MTNLDTVVKTTTITVIYKNTKTQTSNCVLLSLVLELVEFFEACRRMKLYAEIRLGKYRDIKL